MKTGKRGDKKRKKRPIFHVFSRCECFKCQILETLAFDKHATFCGLEETLVDNKVNELFSQTCMVELQFSEKPACSLKCVACRNRQMLSVDTESGVCSNFSVQDFCMVLT